MSAQVINFDDERKRRAVLRKIHALMWAWFPPEDDLSDLDAVLKLRSVVTPELHRLATGRTRLAKALQTIITILGAQFSSPRAQIDALWKISPVGQAWFRNALHLPHGSASDIGSR